MVRIVFCQLICGHGPLRVVFLILSCASSDMWKKENTDMQIPHLRKLKCTFLKTQTLISENHFGINATLSVNCMHQIYDETTHQCVHAPCEV